MTHSWRTTVLADRHRALGSALEDWIGMPTAWTYDAPYGPEETYIAIRTKAALMDVSGLKKVHLTGPHAAGILDMITTRDVTKITPGKCAYTTMLNDAGKFIDDGIIFCRGPNDWMLVHGGGAGHELLVEACVGRNVSMLFDDDLHDMSLQGPVAVDFLAKHIPGVRDMKYFTHMSTTLFGKPITLSRTGYTGERGYEIFCSSKDAVTIWDRILDEGKEMGIIPASFVALDWLRVESYLLFYPFDMSEFFPFESGEAPGDTLWELGLDFTVSPKKTGFRGADAHWRAKGKERFRIFGVKLEGTEIAQGGDEVWAGGKKVGVITVGMYSPLMKQSMALARLSVAAAVDGTALEVRGAGGATKATATNLPFYDPDKKKRAAVG
jgi:aminomethyltransferase